MDIDLVKDSEPMGLEIFAGVMLIFVVWLVSRSLLHSRQRPETPGNAAQLYLVPVAAGLLCSWANLRGLSSSLSILPGRSRYPAAAWSAESLEFLLVGLGASLLGVVALLLPRSGPVLFARWKVTVTIGLLGALYVAQFPFMGWAMSESRVYSPTAVRMTLLPLAVALIAVLLLLHRSLKRRALEVREGPLSRRGSALFAVSLFAVSLATHFVRAQLLVIAKGP